jgi:hypothetical protein
MLRHRRVVLTTNRQPSRQSRSRLRRDDVSRFASWQRAHGVEVAPLVRLVRLLTR